MKLDSVWTSFEYGCLYALLLTHFKVVFELFNVPNYSNGNYSSTTQLIRYFLSFAFRTLLASQKFGGVCFRIQHLHGMVPSKIGKNCSLFKAQHEEDAPQLDPSRQSTQLLHPILNISELSCIASSNIIVLSNSLITITRFRLCVPLYCNVPLLRPNQCPAPAEMDSVSITMRKTVTPNLLLKKSGPIFAACDDSLFLELPPACLWLWYQPEPITQPDHYLQRSISILGDKAPASRRSPYIACLTRCLLPAN